MGTRGPAPCHLRGRLLALLLWALALPDPLTAAAPHASSGLHSFQSPNRTEKAKRPSAQREKPAPETKEPLKYYVSGDEAESRGFYAIIDLYKKEICMKEVPFLLALHRSFYKDERLSRGRTLVLGKGAIVQLQRKTARLKGMEELDTSLISGVDSAFLYKRRENRRTKELCNFVVYVKPCAYPIPKTGANIMVPRRVAGSVHYESKTGKMVVYTHTGGIKLELPGYAKTLTLGLMSDMDIGFAELEPAASNWTARLLYVKKHTETARRGWSLNLTECGQVRPYSD